MKVATDADGRVFLGGAVVPKLRVEVDGDTALVIAGMVPQRVHVSALDAVVVLCADAYARGAGQETWGDRDERAAAIATLTGRALAGPRDGEPREAWRERVLDEARALMTDATHAEVVVISALWRVVT